MCPLPVYHSYLKPLIKRGLTERTRKDRPPLEARGCDKAGLGDGGRDGKYWGGELKSSSTGRRGFISAVQDRVHKMQKARLNLSCCSQNSLLYGKHLRGIRLKPNQFLMDFNLHTILI
uniref:Uncharacterized protein n=1 Tax=Taeniopygia guttata TaxID=59729 RepID=A0A674G7B5_TAEGU